MFNNRCSKKHKKQFFFLLFKLFYITKSNTQKKIKEKCYLNVVIDEKLIEKLMPNDEQITKHFNKRGKKKKIIIFCAHFSRRH